jgi:putative endonuclease
VTNRNQIIGKTGETAAVAFIRQQGYTLLEQNYRAPFAEIDIIASQAGCICFIEVKTRTSLKRGLPRESVHHLKQQKIISGAWFYLKEKKIVNQPVRFDVIDILLTNAPPKITLIKNAFGTV